MSLSYRSRRTPVNLGRTFRGFLSVSMIEELEAGRKHTVAVRVVEFFGNDAAGTIDVEAYRARPWTSIFLS